MKKHHKKRTDKPRSAADRLVVVVFVGLILFAFALPLMVGRTAPVTATKTTVPTPNVTTKVEDGVRVAAWCDHMPIGKKQTNQYVFVSADKNVEINSCEVRHDNKLLGASVRLGKIEGEELNHLRTIGMFDEGMHGAKLEVTVHYTVTVGCVRLKKVVVLHCEVEVAN